MSADQASGASPPLSVDVQRALQQAVGDANNAANITKKSKRARDVGPPSGDAGDVPVKKRKTKRAQDVPADDAQVRAGTSESSATTDTTPFEQAAHRKKGKDKEKERHKEAEPEIQPVGPLPSNSLDASAEFISAVVAAASATASQPPPSEQPQYEHPMPPPFLDYSHAYAPYPYTPPHQPGAFVPPHPPPMYHDPAALLPDLSFASSEDLLRTLQEFDLSKVMNVLRSLGEAATAANVSVTGPPPPFMPHVPQSGPPPVNQKPANSDAIVGRPSRPKASARPVETGSVNPSLPGPPPPEAENAEHAHMLANVWMNAAKLAEMVKKEGLVYKKGKFSAIEEAQLNAAIEHYRVTKGLTGEQLNELIYSKERGRDTFWQEITSALHLRPIIAVYHHVRRMRHPWGQQGKWMPTEDDLLLEAVAELGQQWEKVSRKVGRMSSDCRDRWRNHLQDRGTRQSGPWTKEEEEQLTRIVKEMTVEKGRDMDNDIFWGVVSQRMGGRRGRQQCRIKWTDTLSTQIKNAGEKPRWSQTDAYILVHKIDSLNVRDDSEIDWKSLPDEHWNIWSAHTLQRRWVTMKRGIKGFEEMSHAEIMEILKTKKTQALPPQSGSRKKKNKVTSAEAVADPDDLEETIEDVGPIVGGVPIAII